MTYPEPTYLARDGEVSATYRPGATEADLRSPTARVAYLATGASTDGSFGLYRWAMTAAPSGPSPHFHRTMSESFYVLLGAVRIYDGARWLDTVPGDFVHVPPGGVHAFRNASGAAAEMLILFTPGAPREAYFEALAELAEQGRPLADDERTEFLRRHDQYEV